MIYSYSRLKLFEQCPAAFAYKYLLELLESPSEPLVLGKAVHATIERYLNGDDMQSAVIAAVSKAELPLDEEEVKALVGHQEVLDIVGGTVEQHFSLPLDDSGNIILQGYIDWFKDDSNGIYMKDWKSNRILYKPKDNHQLGLYAWALSQLTGANEVHGELVFLRYQLISDKFKHTYTQQDMAQAQQWALGLATEIEEKIFKINMGTGDISDIKLFPDKPGVHCQYCSHASLCIRSAKVDPVKIDDVISASKVAAEVIRLEAAVDDLKQKLKSWVKQNDAVRVDDAVFTFVPSVSWQFEDEKLRELCCELERRGIDYWKFLSLPAAKLKKTGLSDDEIRRFAKRKETLTFRHVKAS